MVMRKYFVGIDLGTGSTKAVAVDTEGNTLSTAQYHYITSNPQPGYSEQNPHLIWQAFVLCINDITSKLGSEPIAISFSAAMHSIMPVDKDGAALSDAILWADSRSGDIAESIRVSTQGEDIYRHTGTAIYAMSPLCKLIWLRENSPGLFNKAYKFISIKEYIWYKLFGVFEVDYSIASATGLFDILALSWYDKSLALAGINSEKLSKPVDTETYRFLTDFNKLLPGISVKNSFCNWCQ
jgi:gluconokinase